MKKLIALGTLVAFNFIGPWGCGHITNPTSPMSKSTTTSATIPNPIFASAWSSAGSTAFVNPQGIALDSNHNVYVTDLYLGEVFEFDENGNLLAQWGNTGSNPLNEPMGIVIENGNIYVADAANARIVEFSSTGSVLAELTPTTPDGSYLFNYPTGVSVDNLGNLYVADNTDEVYEFNASLQLVAQWGVSGATQGLFNYPVVAVEDSLDNVYVANNNADNVIKFNINTGAVSKWGQSGQQNGQFNGPSDVKLDVNGNVYVVDSGNNRIQIFNASGSFLSVFGDVQNSTQGLNLPESMAIDSNGTAYVVDNGNNRIVKYTLN